jgi:hypothetical protein
MESARRWEEGRAHPAVKQALADQYKADFQAESKMQEGVVMKLGMGMGMGLETAMRLLLKTFAKRCWAKHSTGQDNTPADAAIHSFDKQSIFAAGVRGSNTGLGAASV